MVRRPVSLFALLAASCCWWRSAGTTAESDAGASLQEQLRTPKFVCPWLCSGCCQATRRYLVLSRQDKGRFTCIVRPDSAPEVIEKLARNCSKLVGKHKRVETVCRLTQEEQKLGAAGLLHQCVDEPLVRTYAEFLKGSCSLTSLDGALGRGGVVGWAIDKMYFQVKSTSLGGVCEHKGKELQEAGKFEHLCSHTCASPTARVCNSCHALVKADICSTLSADLKTGRIDVFAMAVWASAAGALVTVDKIPLPSSEPHLLKKIAIPGWTAKTVAIEAPPEDDPINLANGGFMCMMAKLQELPLQDDVGDDGNRFVTDLLRPGLGAQSALAPRSAGDTLLAYFERYLLYPQRLHFDVPAGELLTDRTLERLVFEAVGAHRLELLDTDRPQEGINPMAPPLENPQRLVGQLPPAVRKEARFAVRLEGFFDDLPVRKDMARWGGNAYFSSEGKLIAIQYNGQVATPNYRELAEDDQQEARGRRLWEYHKFVFRSSLVSTVTIFDHLMATHILVSQAMALAVHEILPPRHVLRMLLFPHTYKGLAINFKAANVFFSKGMFVHRASPWGDEAFERKVQHGVLWQKGEVLSYTTFPSLFKVYERYRLAVPEMPLLPFFEDGALLHRAIEAHVVRSLSRRYPGGPDCDTTLQDDKMVEKFLHRFFELGDASTKDFWPRELRRRAHQSCQALQALLTEYIFVATGFHSHVGSVADFFRDTRFAATAWKEGELEPRPKQAMMMMLVASMTSADMPTLGSDFREVFREWQGVEGAPDFEVLEHDLQSVQASIVERNEERLEKGQLQFHQMEPKHVHLGVYV